MANELISKPQYVFDNADTFETAQRMANALCESTLVPKEYRGKKNLPNVIVALEVANRTGASVLMIMQNLYVINGRPSWSSQFVIAGINSCGRFSPLQFKITKDKEEKELIYKFSETTWSGNQKSTKVHELKRTFFNIACVAYAKDKDGNLSESPPVSIETARLEGWYDKKGSKWPTMPELMLRYRAASSFGKLYAPEILMGLSTVEESRDLEPIKDITPSNTEALTKRFKESNNLSVPPPPPKAHIVAEDTQPKPVVYEVGRATDMIGDLLGMPDRTKDDLKAKGMELMRLIEDGGDKVELMQKFGGIEFLDKLKVAGLETYVQTIREM